MFVVAIVVSMNYDVTVRSSAYERSYNIMNMCL